MSDVIAEAVGVRKVYDTRGVETVALAGVDLAEQNVDLSEESLRVVQERYRLGLATILELQDAQITLTQAEVDLVSRRFDYEVAIAAIEALLGRSLDQP